MKIQYISDSMGHTTAVQIPIDEWEKMVLKYKELRQDLSTDIPDWQKELALKEIEAIQKGEAGLSDWDEIKKEFNSGRL